MAWERVQVADVKHTDGTSWLQSGLSRALWTIATAAATVFKIVVDGSKQTLEPLYGALQGILVSNRAKALNFWATERRQVCWAQYLEQCVIWCAFTNIVKSSHVRRGLLQIIEARTTLPAAPSRACRQRYVRQRLGILGRPLARRAILRGVR